MTSSVVRIVLNGADREILPGTSVSALLHALGQDPAWVAVERNRNVIKKSHYHDVVLQAGDHVEVVTLVGGG